MKMKIMKLTKIKTKIKIKKAIKINNKLKNKKKQKISNKMNNDDFLCKSIIILKFFIPTVNLF